MKTPVQIRATAASSTSRGIHTAPIPGVSVGRQANAVRQPSTPKTTKSVICTPPPGPRLSALIGCRSQSYPGRSAPAMRYVAVNITEEARPRTSSAQWRGEFGVTMPSRPPPFREPGRAQPREVLGQGRWGAGGRWSRSWQLFPPQDGGVHR